MRIGPSSPKEQRITWSGYLISLNCGRYLMSTGLLALYLGIFVFAESAFIVMAIKEYLQDLVRLAEIDLIRGKPTS